MRADFHYGPELNRSTEWSDTLMQHTAFDRFDFWLATRGRTIHSLQCGRPGECIYRLSKDRCVASEISTALYARR